MNIMGVSPQVGMCISSGTKALPQACATATCAQGMPSGTQHVVPGQVEEVGASTWPGPASLTWDCGDFWGLQLRQSGSRVPDWQPEHGFGWPGSGFG